MSTPDETQPSPEPGSGAVSRRVLIGSGLLVLGAIGGGVAGFVATGAPREVVPDPVPPADVLAAIGRERDLLDLYDAAGGTDPLRAHIRSEHAAHVAALTALLPAGVTPTPSTSAPGSPTTPATAPTTAGLVAAERAAADAARTACLAGNGTASVLLACIAASEASHAAVLT